MEFRVVTRRGGRIRRAFLGGIRGPNHGGSDSNGNFGGIEARRNNSSSGGSGESFAVVWRRFTAFRQLHYDITAVLRGSHHMIESLPPLPGKITWDVGGSHTRRPTRFCLLCCCFSMSSVYSSLSFLLLVVVV